MLSAVLPSCHGVASEPPVHGRRRRMEQILVTYGIFFCFIWEKSSMVSEARSLDRDVESGLTFTGFAVFNCTIRPDSASVLNELKDSSHDLVMITGDQALTACHLASQVHIISKPSLILVPNDESFKWVSRDEADTISFSENQVEDLSDSHDLRISGDCFETLLRTGSLLQVIPYVKVFSRVSPEQKELILTTLKTVGRMTLISGDGTNDVGALKQRKLRKLLQL